MSVIWGVRKETPEQILAIKRLLEAVEIMSAAVEHMTDAGISEITLE
jgi:hypothetical protein